MKEYLQSIVVTTAFLSGVVYGLLLASLLRHHSPSENCAAYTRIEWRLDDGDGLETWIDKIEAQINER